MDQRFFGHFGGHRIVMGRFIVTKYGGVVDIQARKVINDEQDGELLGLEDGIVFYRIDNSLRPGGLFCFDLKELKVAKVEKGGHWDLPGLQSPDKTMSIEAEKSYKGMLQLHRPGKAPQDLAKVASFQFSILSSEVSFGQTPCLWLDGERILAARTNSKLVILNIKGEEEASIEVKNARTEILATPSLRRDPLGRVIYYCSGEDFLIDIPNRSASALERYALGNDFEATVATDKASRRTVFHDGKAIGQWVFNPREAVIAPALLAFPYAQPDEGVNLGYPHGIAVWNARTGAWQTIEVWPNDLIGWTR